MHYLYKITNIINGKIYIGQTIEVNRRWQAHKSYAKNPEKTGQYVHRAMAKYGIENFTFEVVATCLTFEDADKTETILIQQYDSRNNEKGYNIKPGGEVWDDEMRYHMSEKMKQHYQNHPEASVRISKQVKERWANPEFKAKVSEAIKGHSNPMKGKKLSEEQRLKILNGVKHLKGINKNPHPQEILDKIANTKTGFSEEKKRDITEKIIAARGQVVLTMEQKQAIMNDSRSSYAIAKDYNVNPSTIQRIKKQNK